MEGDRQTWPLNMINAAHKAGNLNIAPATAELLLDSLATLKQQGVLSKANVEKLLQGTSTPANYLPF